jgi:hypothetical protein
MALVLADRVQETTTTTGTGTVTLLGAVTGFQSFAAIGNANTTYYTIAGQTGSEWEVGLGTYTASGTTLSRATVLGSSNSGSLVNFSAGTKNVFVTYPASQASLLDGTQTFTNKTLTTPTVTSPTINGTSSDANWKYRVARFDFEGANGDTVAYNYVNNLTSLTNSAALSTTQVKYGTTSLACSGGATSGLPQLVPTLPLGLLTNNFCIEQWIYPTSFTNAIAAGMVEIGTSSTARVAFYFTSATQANLRLNATSNLLTLSTIGISLNTWTHIAIERTSTAANGLKLYINGTLQGTFTFATSIPTTWNLYIGSTSDGYPMAGYIDDFRLTAATVYGAAFTPPTAALPISPYVITGMGPVGF